MYIEIKKDEIAFVGYGYGLDRKITICLYTGGIGITPGWHSAKLPCHYESILGDDMRIYDPLLAQILRERGIIGRCYFLRTPQGYIESSPHRMP